MDALRERRQARHESVSKGKPLASATLIGRLDLHSGHVHARRTLPPAGLTAHAEVHGLGHLWARDVTLELPTQGKPQGVGAPPNGVNLLAGDAKTGAHHTDIEFPTMAIVVAHLHSL